MLEPRILVEDNPVVSETVFELKNKNAFARMAIMQNKYVVLKGSTAVQENRLSIPTFIVKLRQDLVDAGIMLDHSDGLYIFMQDATFNSPSYAAAAIVGGYNPAKKPIGYIGSNRPYTMNI
nr:DUF4357 domain-containing protein [Sporomusa silvacetica]